MAGVAWMCRFAAFWFLLEAFRVGGSVQNVLLVFGVNQVAGAVPFTPGGAGVQQALLVKVFAGAAPTAVVAAYSVGQQIAIATSPRARRARCGRVHLSLPLVQGGDRRGSRLARGRAEAERAGVLLGDDEEPSTEGPRAPRARA